MGEGEPIKNGIDSMSSDEFSKFLDQFRKKVKTNVETEQPEKLIKKRNEADESRRDK